ncbi:MAG: hypothetical protein ACTSW3_04555, partial [Promethearchaeota archaeon]
MKTIKKSDKAYQIVIEPEDNLNPIEISKCFTKQYPKEVAVIIFKEIQINIGMLITGVKINKL